jgi:hypothetical protein
MAISTRIKANHRPGVKGGEATPAPKKDFGSATGYAKPAKTKAGLTGSPKKK